MVTLRMNLIDWISLKVLGRYPSILQYMECLPLSAHCATNRVFSGRVRRRV